MHVYVVYLFHFRSFLLSQEEQTALHEAAFQGHPKVVALLVRRGADIDRQSDVCGILTIIHICILYH